MIRVSKEQFYKVIYDHDLDVCVYSRYNNITKIMTTDFKFRSGKMFGISISNHDLSSDDYDVNTYDIDEAWLNAPLTNGESK